MAAKVPGRGTGGDSGRAAAGEAPYFSQRLLEALAPMGSIPLTVVEAPMGYGKTVAARERLRRPDGLVVWTTAFGASPESFWRDFAGELGRRLPEAAKSAAALRRMGFPHDPVLAGAAMEILSGLSDPSRPLVLAFDDCHLLPNSFADFCDALAARERPGLRLVCLTRDSWPGARQSLALKGVLAVIGRDSLALGPPEIAEFFLSRGLGLDPGQAGALREQTGGWISALSLLLRSYRRDGRLRSSPDIGALVEREVYGVLSDDAKGLMMSLAPLKRFTAAQAKFLHGGTTGQLLDELAGKNPFIMLDHDTRTYYVHNIFKECIVDKFNDLPPADRRAIHLACGRWHLQAGETVPALECLHLAGEHESALAALESDLAGNLVTENAAFFAAMFRACPDDLLRRHPGAAFKYAIALYSAGDYRPFVGQLAWLARLCGAMPPGPEADAWRGELELLRSLLAFNDIRAMSVHHRRANELLGRPTGLYAPDSPWTLGCPSVLFMFHRGAGRLAEEIALMRECLPHYYRLASHHGAGGEHLFEAEALFNAGRFDEASILLARGEAMARRHRQTGNLFCALFLRLRLGLMGAGDGQGGPGGGLGGGLVAIEAMRGLVERSKDYYLLHTVDLCDGWLHAALDRPDRVPSWLRQGSDGGGRLYSFARGFFSLVWGRAALLEGRSAEVLGALEAALEEGALANNLMFAIYAGIYRSIALSGLGRAAEAMEALREAVEAAWPDEIYMPFVENHSLVGPLLEEIRPAGLMEVAELAGRLEAARAKAARELGRAGPSPFGLTAREMETLRLAAEGLTHAEMAGKLSISTNTVKAHLKAGYRKCGAKNRTELRRIIGDLGKDHPKN